MKIACVIFLYTEDTRFLNLALNLIASIRKFDDIPIHVLAPEKHLSTDAYKTLLEIDVDIWEEPLTRQKRWRPYELTKIEAIKHTEYDKILLMDADCLAIEPIRPLFDLPTLTANEWRNSPLIASRLLLEPNTDDYLNLIKLKALGFSKEKGWNNHGKFQHWITGEPTEWTFQCAESSQGLLYYYYKILKNQFHVKEMEQVYHFGKGDDKFGSKP